MGKTRGIQQLVINTSGIVRQVTYEVEGIANKATVWHGAMRRYQEAPELSARFVSEFGSTMQST